MKFRSSFLDAGGEWKSIEVPGPSSFGVWEECWSVFEAACIADGIATQATLAMYAAEFKSRVRDYGAGCWQLCVEADVIARSEQFVHERARQLAAHRAKPEGSSYDPDRPWESVIRAVALDRGFWDRQLEKPALRRELQGAPRVPAFQAEGERENPSKREAPPAKDPRARNARGTARARRSSVVRTAGTTAVATAWSCASRGGGRRVGVVSHAPTTACTLANGAGSRTGASAARSILTGSPRAPLVSD